MYGINEIDPQTLAQWQREGKPFRLVDVRSPAEFAQGMIPRGEQLPLHLLPLRVNELAADETTVFYCRTGARSAQACSFMAQRGNANVYNLRGGIIGWAREGLPLAGAAG